MREGINETTESTKNSHLLPGVKRIMTCVGSPEDYGPEGIEELFDNFRDFDFDTYKDIRGVTSITWGANTQGFLQRGFLVPRSIPNAERYIISPLDNTKKYSREFKDCTTLIVTGISKKTGKNISFMTHQKPKPVLGVSKEEFMRDLNLRLEEAKSQCKPGTIDAVIEGGNYINHSGWSGASNLTKESKENYISSITLVSDLVKKVMEFEPTVVNGPKTDDGEDHIYFDTKTRNVHLLRTPNMFSNKKSLVNTDRTGKFKGSSYDFVASQAEEQKKKWEKN